MAPERLLRIRAVYEAAVETPAAGRQALLENECQGDEELLQEVEQLLAAREHLPEWLSGPLLGAVIAGLLEGRPTVTHPVPAGQVHFPPGAVLAQRYRIVHFLGRGGMGAVFRADDLLLDQPVALKFLPAGATASTSALSRFRNEVRTARQVSHSNVCRVYDIGEAEGLTYLSMEYVDGEDLASLLRRIGKLPQDKGLQVARQLCAGLGAAHDKGVIHRDLKPANIMLDGKGQVRITDFGIAGVAEQIRDVQSGTPAYISPEQLAGKEVTARSDIYALGTVLCELLTGKRPPLQPADPGSTALEPEVERVIQRCLDPDPQMRPPTALAVSAALPGGDPLAAALSRGETPEPEVVANAGPVEGLRPWVAVGCLGAVIAGLGLLCVLRQKHDLINQIPMEKSSEVLASKARDIAKAFGYPERPVDVLYSWTYDTDYLRYAGQHKDAALAPYPPAVYFWYRQSPHAPNTPEVDYDLAALNRERLEPGMQLVVLDSEGELLEFHARAPADSRGGSSAETFDWNRLFTAAGLDAGRFQPVQPRLNPTVPFNLRAAWTGSAKGNETVRVEAAVYQGRPVFFRVLGLWAEADQPAPVFFGGFSLPVFILFMLAVPLAAGLVAWRNSRSGRGDPTRTRRLAAFAFCCMLCNSLVGEHHVASQAEFIVLFDILRYATFAGCLAWVSYMALEPQVRKQLPVSLISWNRLLAGRFRDPLAGGHMLTGVTLGVSALYIAQAFFGIPFIAFLEPVIPWSGGSPVLSLWFVQPVLATAVALSTCSF